MKNILFQRLITAVLVVCLTANPALAQQPLPEMIHQQAEELSLALEVDRAADQARQASIKESSNGTKVVDIVAATAGGVSHNQFTQFNVDTSGLIFNNSQGPVLSELGGWMDGNRRLAGGEAKIILNEVTGTSRSQLLGAVEIAGKSAEFVLANSNGITCNGCGFINTPRVTLTTGKPQFSGSNLSGFNVTGGDVRVDGSGLNASNIDRFDIVSRAASINAEIYAKNLSIYTGKNQFDYTNSNITALNSPTTGPDFQLALDASSLGAMYANSIRLIGTEAGMGVNTQGLIQSVTDLNLSANGNITLKNAQANDSVNITSTLGNVTTEGLVYGENINLNGVNLNNTGVLAAEKTINLTAQSLNQSGNLLAGLDANSNLLNSGNLNFNQVNSFNNTGTTYVGGKFNAVATNINNNQGQLILQTEQNLAASGNITNQGVLQFNQNDIKITAKNLANNDGAILVTGSANTTSPNSPTNLTITATDAISNISGQIQAANTINLVSKNLDNTQGSIASNIISANAESIKNTQGTMSAGSLRLTTNSLNNDAGTLVASNASE
jgi:filamentous hemagglutinin